jgi:hypothetical protein
MSKEKSKGTKKSSGGSVHVKSYTRRKPRRK